MLLSRGGIDLPQAPRVVCCAGRVCASPPDAADHHRRTPPNESAGLGRHVEIRPVSNDAAQDGRLPREGCNEPHSGSTPEADDYDSAAGDALLRGGEVEESRSEPRRLAAAHRGKGCGERRKEGAFAPRQGSPEV